MAIEVGQNFISGLFLFAYNISAFFLALNHEEIIGSFDWIDVLIRTSF